MGFCFRLLRAFHGCKGCGKAFLVCLALVLCHSVAEPEMLLVLGGSRSAPFKPSNSHGDYGTRLGLAFPTSLLVGEMTLPLEIGLSLRTATIGFSDWFGRDVFTDLQMPFIFHGSLPFHKRLEILALWTPGYTLDMVSTSRLSGKVAATQSLRTLFNMGLGGGLQYQLPWGLCIRGHWVYNLFSPYPTSRLTWADMSLDILIPLVWKKKSPA